MARLPIPPKQGRGHSPLLLGVTMPKVGGKKFPYTPAGKKAAADMKKKSGKKK